MAKVRKELRDELFQLRLQLEIVKKQGLGDSDKAEELENQIKAVRKQISNELVEEKERERNGKKI